MDDAAAAVAGILTGGGAAQRSVRPVVMLRASAKLWQAAAKGSTVGAGCCASLAAAKSREVPAMGSACQLLRPPLPS